MKKKKEKLTTNTLKFIGNIMINSRERIIRRHEMIKNKLELSVEFTRVVTSFHNDVKLIIRIINGLPILDDSFLDLGYIPEDPLNTYAYKSILWEGRLNNEPIDSNIYKGRFIMNMLLSIDSNFIEIIDGELDLRGDKKDSKEAISLVYQIRDCLGNFILMLADNKNDYRNELLKVSELVVMSDVDYFKKSKKALGVFSRELNRLEDMLNPTFLDGKRPSDDILIQNVCLIAYVMATGSSNVKNTFMVPENFSIKDKESIKTLVEILGSCIINRRISQRPYPEVYRWYIHSLPKVYYRFKDINYNQSLAEGCRALSFVSFYAGSKSITKLIGKLIY